MKLQVNVKGSWRGSTRIRRATEGFPEFLADAGKE